MYKRQILSEAKRAYVPLSKLDLDELRVAAAKAYNALKSLNIKSIKLASYVAECQKLSFEALAEGFLLGSYEFNKYKEKKEKYTLKEIIFSTEEFSGKKVDLKAANEGFKEAEDVYKRQHRLV